MCRGVGHRPDNPIRDQGLELLAPSENPSACDQVELDHSTSG